MIELAEGRLHRSSPGRLEPLEVLFIHQNLPGQYARLMSFLAQQPHVRVRGLGESENLKGKALPAGATVIGYGKPPGAGGRTHAYLRGFESAVRRGQAVARACLALKNGGYRPAIVFAHSGWGEALFIKDVFPDARLVVFAEFYWRAQGFDVGFDPEYPTDPEDIFRLRVRPAYLAQSILSADWAVSPTHWQKSSHPPELQQKISVIHEGVDSDFFQPDDAVQVVLPNGTRLGRDTPVLTFVARNLEPYRGFHTFMRALPAVLERVPDAHALIVGGDEVSYGRSPKAPFRSYQEQLLAEVGPTLPADRVHVLGRLPYSAYRKVLQVSRVHTYFTYPFVLSWSMLEAMATGCQVLASDTAPVREVISDGDNGRLFGFFDSSAFVTQAADMLNQPPDPALRMRARQSIVDRFDFRRVGLPAYLDLIGRLVPGSGFPEREADGA